MMSRKLRRSVAALTAASACVAGAGAIAASPASAERIIICNSAACKTYCRQYLPDGNTVDYGEGTQITVTTPNGKKRSFTCKDGNWVEGRPTPPTSGVVAPVGPAQGSPEGNAPPGEGAQAT